SVAKYAADPDAPGARTTAVAGLIGGAAAAGISLWITFSDSEGTKTLRAVDEGLQGGKGNASSAFAHPAERLVAPPKRDRQPRNPRSTLPMSAAGARAAGAPADVIFDHSNNRLTPAGLAALYGSSAFILTSGVMLFSGETATERLVRVYREDPSLKMH